MNRFKNLAIVPLIVLSLLCGSVLAQHNHGGHKSAKVEAPKVFLDKSPKVVEYQLKRLTNEQLLLVERKNDDPKYLPVYASIATRPGLPLSDRKDAIESMANIHKSSVVAESMAILNRFEESVDNQRLSRDLVQIVIMQSHEELKSQSKLLKESLDAKSAYARRAAWASVLQMEPEAHWAELVAQSDQRRLDFLSSIPWIGVQEKRNALRGIVVRIMLENPSIEIKTSAIQALETMDAEMEDSFIKIASLFATEALRPSVIRALIKIPPSSRDAKISSSLAKDLVAIAEATPAAKRTEEGFLDAIQLVEGLLPKLEPGIAREYRQRLDAVSVRVVRIATVIEEMRYDLKYFAVEAGRPTQLILKNKDLMPHNLVVTKPGKLKDIALLAATMGPDEAPEGKQYVPQSSDVLMATGMVAANKQESLTFTAPLEIGEYPFVCTFPNHWMRMYGVMVVVKDLDAWSKEPPVPKDPIGNNRSFVKNWKLHDLESEIEMGLRGRSDEIGARIFKEATCAQCHPLGTDGRNVGPSLVDVATRWKGDKAGILREILEPSFKIDPKFSSYSVLTEDGTIYSGLLIEESNDSVSILSGADQESPSVIPRNEISNMVKSSLSIMPNGLLDQYSKDEIFELLAYLLKQTK